MKPIPKTENALVLRTDFSDQAVWEDIRATILKPVGPFRFGANVDFLDDSQYANIGTSQILDLLPHDYDHTFMIVADQTAISHPEHPLLIVDLFEKSAREFRAVPSQIQSIENNLSIANMDFEEFAESVDEDRVFRGFPED
ncbi:MAG TPA: hypothetical protein VJ785_13940 [Anaerolineales bacterium]|nr:hypothetical protein [Anaerolineales bacterium]